MKKKGITIITVLVAVLIIAGIYLGVNFKTLKDMYGLKNFTYNGVFISMYENDNYAEADFATYRGISTVKMIQTVDDTKLFRKYLDMALESENQVTHVYLGVEPYDAVNNEWLEVLQSYVTSYPDITFEILLSYPSLESWLEFDDEVIEEKIAACYAFVDGMDDYGNVMQYYLGGEEWLIANPDTYEDGQANTEISHMLTLLCFCDHEYLIASGNASILIGRLETLLLRERDARTTYPDLSDEKIVFFGDSVFGNYQGSHSIPGVVAGLTDASVDNRGVGGATAASKPDMEKCFMNSLDGYLSSGDSDATVYVLNFGLNDYFSGQPVENPEDTYDVESYAGALRTGIMRLREKNPTAAIVVLAPTYASSYSGGTDILRQDGVASVLYDYVEMAMKVAQEMDVYGLNMYEEFGVNAENHHTYLADDCHPNMLGRYVMGNIIIEYLEKEVNK